MICIVDYGTGNVMSIFNMLSYIGVKSMVISDPKELKNASKIILPGVGSFDNAMNKINNLWIQELNENVLIKQKYILGICLGMQIMCKRSEEGKLDGLAWIDANVNKFRETFEIKVPHMGWNHINVVNYKNTIIDTTTDQKFYFVHSYYVELNDLKSELCTTNYGLQFTSGFQKENIYGVQFHPEKSHRYGMKLLEKFSKLN